jgi:hypothetical protein
MNNTNTTNKSFYMVNEFIKKIYELDKSKNTLEEKIVSIDNLINNLIDYFIKKKIFYYVENKISYTNITFHFKSHLIKFIKNLIDPSDNIIKKYISPKTSYEPDDNSTNTKKSDNPNWENVSDINSLMFRNFKKLNESFEKNVSFHDNIQINNYDDSCGCEGFEFNVKSSNINSNLLKVASNNDDYNLNNGDNNCIENKNQVDIKNLSLYIKILVNQNKYLVEFIDKLTQMCKILSDPEIKYKKSNPFDK